MTIGTDRLRTLSEDIDACLAALGGGTHDGETAFPVDFADGTGDYALSPGMDEVVIILDSPKGTDGITTYVADDNAITAPMAAVSPPPDDDIPLLEGDALDALLDSDES